MRRIFRDDSGVTLIELTVALVILGLVLSMVYSLLLNGTRMWHQGEEKVDTQQNLRVAMNFILRDIRAANNVAITPEGFLEVEGTDNGNNYTIIYRLVGNVLQRDKNGSNNPVAYGLKEASFEVDNDLVTVSLTAEKPNGDDTILISKARARNM